jgi:hypothetical protein
MHRSRMLVALVGIGLLGCGPSPDADAQALCRQVPTSRQQVAAIAERVPATTDFDVISRLLMELYTATEPLQDWSYVATDELNGPVRRAAREALLHTGGYEDGGNPITGAELISNLSSAASRWDELETACAALA